jgi:hypothetical protein
MFSHSAEATSGDAKAQIVATLPPGASVRSSGAGVTVVGERLQRVAQRGA